MTQSARPRLASKILVATAALVAAVHAAHAAPPAAAGAQGAVVDQMPMHRACPAVAAADLADALNDAWDDAGKPSAVDVTFKVQRHHVYAVAPATGSARTWHQIRHALNGLHCDGGDDQVHAVRFTVRFEDRAGAARVAAVDEEPDR
jgi:hypothetical protein